MRKFRRVGDPDGACIGGVCAGLAYMIGVQVWLVRLISLMLLLSSVGWAAVPYLMLWFVLPEWTHLPDDFSSVTGD